MRWASRMVDKRWAITSVVRPSINRSNAARTCCSFTASKWEVASSKTRTGEFFSSARAMEMRQVLPSGRYGPGSYWLRFDCSGFRPVEIPVLLKEGQTESISVYLEQSNESDG